MSKSSTRAAPLTPEAASRLFGVIDRAVHNFRGSVDELESAIGMYALGRHVGWKVLYLVHSKKTVSKYEAILGIKVREEFPEVGPEAHRALAFRAAETLSNFWKVVSGETKLDLERDQRRMME